MNRSEQYRKDKKKSVGVGLVYTLIFHILLMFITFSTGLKALYPPPPEQGILIEFIEEEPKPIEVKTGIEPRAVVAKPEEEIRLVQKSEAQIVAESGTAGVETTMGDEGEVEQPEPERKPINSKALFSSSNNKRDTLAAQVAETVTDALTAGHRDGNTRVGSTDGEPSAKLEGRNIMGTLPLPDYKVEAEGRVVVRILVDQYGTVTNAIPGIQGTTVQNATLWEEAKKAALKAKFNISSSAPAVQEGTITYIFKLR